MHTLGRSIKGVGDRRFRGCFGILGCFVDVNESLAGCSIGSVGSLVISTLEFSVGAGLSDCLEVVQVWRHVLYSPA